MNMIERCPWAATPEIYQRYHDEEWGVPEHDDRQLFEKLILDGAQAGLTWLMILKRREGYRQAFDHFDAKKMADYDDAKIASLLADSGIIRNKLKVAAAITNAKAFLKLQEEAGSFNDYLWQFVGGKPIQNVWEKLSEVPAQTSESIAMSKDLQKRGFKFVGSTICYAFMQAVGMVNDHLVSCPRHAAVALLK